jgi:nucleoid DNA-binding protein
MYRYFRFLRDGIAKVLYFHNNPNIFINFLYLCPIKIKGHNGMACRFILYKRMDIGLLSKMVKELILTNDSVLLPGLGSFMTDIVPSAFSDKGYTINPPYRRLFFRPNKEGNDILADFYADSNKIDRESSSRIINDFLNDIRMVLKEKKTVVFPGLGRLRSTRENNFFFVPDEDLDIYPSGFGLEPVSLKSHEASSQEVAAAVEDLKSIMTSPSNNDETDASSGTGLAVVDDLDNDYAVDEVSDADVAKVDVPEKEGVTKCENKSEVEVESSTLQTISADKEAITLKRKNKIWKTVLYVLLILLCVAAVFLIVFMVLANIAPDFIDSILYTPDELRIINY